MSRLSPLVILLLFCTIILKSNMAPTIQSSALDVKISSNLLSSTGNGNIIRIKAVAYAPNEYHVKKDEVPMRFDYHVYVRAVEKPPEGFYRIDFTLGTLGLHKVSFLGVSKLPVGAIYDFIYDPRLYKILSVKALNVVSELNFTIHTELIVASVLFRNFIGITWYYFDLRSSLLNYNYTYELAVVLPLGTQLLYGYPYVRPEGRLQIERGEVTIIRVKGPFERVNVGYEPLALYLYSAVVALITVAVITAYFKTGWARTIARRFLSLLKHQPAFKSSFLRRMKTPLHKALRGLRHSQKSFLLFIILCLLTLSLASLTGRRPHVNILVLGHPPTTESIIRELTLRYDYVRAYSLEEAAPAFLTWLKDVRALDAVIIADFPLLAPEPRVILMQRIEGFIEADLYVIILGEYLGLEGLARFIYNSYYDGRRVIVLYSLRDLGKIIPGPEVQKVYGLGVALNKPLYEAIAKTTAVLVPLIAFFATFFTTSFILELSSKPKDRSWLEALIFSIPTSFAVFGLAQLVVIFASRSLALPIISHAGLGAFTTTRMLHPALAGGTIPRLVAGVAAILIASQTYLRRLGGADYFLVFALAATSLVITLNPLTSGIALSEFVLTYITWGGLHLNPEALSRGIDIWLTRLMLFFANITAANIDLSRGIAMWFMGVIPLSLASRLNKHLRTLLILFSMFYAGRGISRIGEMEAIKFICSFIPGAAIGVLFTASFLAAEILYENLKQRIWRAG